VLWILAGVSAALLLYEIPTLVTAVLQPLWANPNALQTDFHYYYEAARRFAADDTLLYLPTDDVIAGFAYPPPAIVPFVWLQRLPLGLALAVFTLASYAALIIGIRLWFTYLRRQGMAIARSTEMAIAIIAVALGPSYMNVMIGQVNAFVLLTVVAFVSLASRTPRLAALLLASGIWLKVYPIMLVAIGAWDRRAWKALGWTIVAALVIAIAVLPVIPPAAYRVFFGEVLPARIDKTAIHITNQSLVAFLERFRHSPELFLNWTGQQAVTVSLAVRAFNTVLMGTILVAMFQHARTRASSLPAIAAMLMALVSVVAPLGWGHTYVMMLPLLMLELSALNDARSARAITMVACVAALMIPAGRHLPIDSAPGWLQNVVYSRYLLATAGLMLISAFRIGRTTESTVTSST
jgi:alpha-1,2-mannosyltransferase